MYKESVPKVLEYFGIKYVRVLDWQSGYRNEIWPVVLLDGQIINLTFFKREPDVVDRINRADKVSACLDECKMPVRKRIDRCILALRSDSGTTYAGVYNYLPGSTIPWESYTMERIKNLGKTMSDMHYHLSNTAVDLPSVYDEYLSIVVRMHTYFSRSGVTNAMKRKLGVTFDGHYFEKFNALLDDLKLASNQQPLHMDFVRGNVLFNGDEVCGILDFEKTASGHAVVDIARTLAFLLVDCKYKSEAKVTKYFLKSGYVKRGLSNEVKYVNHLSELVMMFLTYDFYKFLAHNPYESLCDNEHYIRTRDILVKSGVIKYG